jgi:hypothetical protein
MRMPATSDALAAIGEHIDRIMTCDLRGRPFLLPIYDAARERQRQPLSLAAATLLRDALADKTNPVVVIVTGFASVALGVGEQDGPVGAVFLGRTLAALGALPLFVTDEHQVDLMRQTLRGGGMNAIDLDRARAAVAVRPSVSSIVGWPADLALAKERSATLLRSLRPAAIVAIERPGANAQGECHQLGGQELGRALCADTDALWREARAAQVPCIGIGDAGNELGLGAVRAAVEHWLSDRRCSTCGGSIAAVLEADATVVAAVSNWGAYAVAAALAATLGRLDILPAAETIERALTACSLAGGRNGHNDYTDPGADGYSWGIECAVASMLTALAHAAAR